MEEEEDQEEDEEGGEEDEEGKEEEEEDVKRTFQDSQLLVFCNAVHLRWYYVICFRAACTGTFRSSQC